jgi:hypothetical protein
MRVIATIEQSEVVEEILTHLRPCSALSQSKGPVPAHSPAVATLAAYAGHWSLGAVASHNVMPGCRDGRRGPVGSGPGPPVFRPSFVLTATGGVRETPCQFWRSLEGGRRTTPAGPWGVHGPAGTRIAARPQRQIPITSFWLRCRRAVAQLPGVRWPVPVHYHRASRRRPSRARVFVGDKRNVPQRVYTRHGSMKAAKGARLQAEGQRAAAHRAFGAQEELHRH